MRTKTKHDLEERLWTPAELAARWRMSVLTLRDWRAQRTGPRAIRIGRRVFYPQTAIAAWEAAQPDIRRAG